MTPLDYLETLYGKVTYGDIVLVKDCRNQVAATFKPHDLEQCAAFIEAYTTDLFIKINPMDHNKTLTRTPYGIGGTAEVEAIVSFHLDVDAGKNDKYLTREKMLEALDKMPCEPSMIIETNGDTGGFHAYWILDEPHYIISDTERDELGKLSASWLTELRRHAVPGTIDGTANLDRILRPVGSLRVKSGNRVRVFRSNDKRYKLQDFVLPTTEEAKPVVDQTKYEGESVIDQYLDSVGLDTPEAILTRQGYSHVKNGFWIRPGSESGQPTGEVFRANGKLGFTVKSGNAAPLSCENSNGTTGRWYSCAALYVAFEHGNDWKRAAKFCYEEIEASKPKVDLSEFLSPDKAPTPKSEANQADHYAKIGKRYRLEPAWTLDELFTAILNEDFVIEDVLIENQPMVVAGEFKTLKTTILIILALCLCSGAKFLGRYEVLKRKRVLFCSAESGKRKIRKTIYAVAKQMGINLAELRVNGFLKLSWWVPKIGELEVMDYFKNEIDKAEADVVMIDPLYQALDDQQASMILNGQQLAALCNYVLDAGATPICCDHVKRSSENARNREPLELSDISGAGKAEYFRQWMLVSRRSKFQPEENRKPHELWLTIGGSEGHSSQLALDIVENFNDEGHMEIEVSTQQRSELIQQTQESSKDKREAAKEHAFQAKLDKALRFFKSNPNELRIKSDIKAHMTCSNDLADSIIHHLIDQELIVKHPQTVRRGVNSCDAFCLPGILILTDSNSEGQEGQSVVVPLVPLDVQTEQKVKDSEGQGQAPIGGCPSVPLSVTKIPVPKKHKKQTKTKTQTRSLS